MGVALWPSQQNCDFSSENFDALAIQLLARSECELGSPHPVAMTCIDPVEVPEDMMRSMNEVRGLCKKYYKCGSCPKGRKCCVGVILGVCFNSSSDPSETLTWHL